MVYTQEGVIKDSRPWAKMLAAGAAAVTISVAMFASAFAATSTVVVTGNTSAGENQAGWLFNRDVTTATPYSFTEDEASIGDGSLFVAPIGTNPSDKFVAENFINKPVADVDSVSFEYKLGSGVSTAEADQVYLNVYANFGSSDDLKFYDCRYNVVAQVGTGADWTTLTFDPTQAYDVTTRGGATPSPYTCPAVPADMNLSSEGSNIRAFAINLGDTTANDQGVSTYFDNVVVGVNSDTTVYDFELVTPDTSAPDVEITSPAAGVEEQGDVTLAATITDNEELLRYYYYVRNVTTGENVVGPTTVYTSEELANLSETVSTVGWDEGEYVFRVEARDAAMNKDAGSVDSVRFSVNNQVDTKEDCKNGGWQSFMTTDNKTFKNQGACVSYVQANANASFKREQ